MGSKRNWIEKDACRLTMTRASVGGGVSGRDAMADDGFVQQRRLRLGMVMSERSVDSQWRLVKARAKMGARSREHVI